jgi:hypothetical protein
VSSTAAASHSAGLAIARNWPNWYMTPDSRSVRGRVVRTTELIQPKVYSR